MYRAIGILFCRVCVCMRMERERERERERELCVYFLKKTITDSVRSTSPIEYHVCEYEVCVCVSVHSNLCPYARYV